MRSVLFEFVKGEIIMNDQENYKGRTDTDSKSQHIDKRKNFIPEEIPVSDGDVGFEHPFLVGGWQLAVGSCFKLKNANKNAGLINAYL